MMEMTRRHIQILVAHSGWGKTTLVNALAQIPSCKAVDLDIFGQHGQTEGRGFFTNIPRLLHMMVNWIEASEPQGWLVIAGLSRNFMDLVRALDSPVFRGEAGHIIDFYEPDLSSLSESEIDVLVDRALARDKHRNYTNPRGPDFYRAHFKEKFLPIEHINLDAMCTTVEAATTLINAHLKFLELYYPVRPSGRKSWILPDS